jgi:hypothetical protein
MVLFLHHQFDFIRRLVIHERGIFDMRWRYFHSGSPLMKDKVPIAVCDSSTSIFAGPAKHDLKSNAIREKTEARVTIPRWLDVLKPVWIEQHRLRRIAAGHFSLKPASYSIYTLQSSDRRARFDVSKPTAF